MDSTWTEDELGKIANSDDLHVAPFCEDGKTYGTLTWIWSVVVNNSLYARAYHGQQSRWYKAAMEQKAGRITIAGITKEVEFLPENGSINSAIDAAYRKKYSESPYLESMISQKSRAATVQILPRGER